MRDPWLTGFVAGAVYTSLTAIWFGVDPLGGKWGASAGLVALYAFVWLTRGRAQ